MGQRGRSQSVRYIEHVCPPLSHTDGSEPRVPLIIDHVAGAALSLPLQTEVPSALLREANTATDLFSSRFLSLVNMA